MKELERLKEVFLNNVDDETRQENLEIIQQFEDELRSSEEYLSWQEHEVTKRIIKQAKDIYKENAFLLATNQSLTEQQRNELFAKQQAILWIISIAERDAKQAIDELRRELSIRLQAFN